MPADLLENIVSENSFGAFIKHSEFENKTNDQIVTKNPAYMFEYDHDIICLFKHRKQEFLDIFAKARESYIEGDWINCTTAPNMALTYNQNDGPTKWMLAYLEKNKLLPPEDWKGVRDIDKKIEPPAMDYVKNNDDDFDDDEED